MTQLEFWDEQTDRVFANIAVREQCAVPVVGDLVYGRRPNARLSEVSGFFPPRQLLHAWRLALRHPSTGARLAACAPLPEDFRNALDFFRNATYY